MHKAVLLKANIAFHLKYQILMRCSHLYFPTLKQPPSEAKVMSHQLMLRSGMIRALASGLYTWLPLGLRVLRKAEAIVREEMNRMGAQEILMPILQPAELWQESQRWTAYGPELLRLEDRHQRPFCLGPTHEEIVTNLLRQDVQSYKQLPLVLYQIQTKFRDEIRPRFGVMRAREFLMKDAYSFHRDKASLVDTYHAMHATYQRIFTRLGLNFRAVLADTGNIGGNASQEFQVLAQVGEDTIFYSDKSDYAANAELAQHLMTTPLHKVEALPLEKCATPEQKTIEAVSDYLSVSPQQCLKLLVVVGRDPEKPLIGLVLRGDHQLNPIKAEKIEGVAHPLRLAEESEIRQQLGAPIGYLGPLGLSIPLIVDHDAAAVTNFVCGANEPDQHYKNVNWQRDVPLPQQADLRYVVVGDPSPDGQGHLQMERGIEVGHIFQLGTKYSIAMNTLIRLENGQNAPLEMGCYGIGISRVVAAAIEQHHDERGIVWPEALAPFQIALVPIGYHRSSVVQHATETLYQQLTEAGFDVLLDDRKESPGFLFADMDLIGIPHRLIVKESDLKEGKLQYKAREEIGDTSILQAELIPFLKQRLAEQSSSCPPLPT